MVGQLLLTSSRSRSEMSQSRTASSASCCSGLVCMVDRLRVERDAARDRQVRVYFL